MDMKNLFEFQKTVIFFGILAQLVLVACAIDTQHHAHNLGTISQETYITVNWTAPQDDNFTSFQLEIYQPIHQQNDTKHMFVDVPHNETTVNVTDLQPGTNYIIKLWVNVTTEIGNTTVSNLTDSGNVVVKTLGYGPDMPCGCDPIGSVDQQCDNHTGQCTCKPNFGGKNMYDTGEEHRTCRGCYHGYYLDKDACKKCHYRCNNVTSYGLCRLKEGTGEVHCDPCKEGSMGQFCQKCADNYYPRPSYGNHYGEQGCRPCNCNGNEDKTEHLYCDKAGRCTHCAFNTTGDNCEKCLPGFLGDPIVAKNCTHPDPRHMIPHPPHQNVVLIGAAIVAGIALVIILAVVGYKKCRHCRGQNNQFWSIKLREDQEAVSFTTYMDMDYRSVDGPPGRGSADASGLYDINRPDVQFSSGKNRLILDHDTHPTGPI
ncbi:unnamed protein product [Owenia fusiformis]|uniref:Uncharacterized protein n=1 Tax=Owenia fusiformis TaxID=6347 RepID=A0A8J1Y1W9_OWEFU|nr:unnamed protein product [Owenia fusiformis]